MPLPVEDLQHVLDHTRDLWEEVRGNRIFITGATGFFGRWLLETFAFANDQLGLGARVVGLTRHPGAFREKAPHLAAHPSIGWVKGDIREFEFPDGEFSHVIHAATTPGSSIPPGETFDTIVEGTRRALDFASVVRAKKFLFTSSGAVYGKQPPELTHLPETYSGAPDPADPASAYGEGKRAAELLCAIARSEHGLETKIARCFAFVGPGLQLDAHFAIGNFIRDALAGGPIRVNGDGTPFRSYLYAADLAIWLWTILFRDESGLPFNVGSEEAVTISELAHQVAQAVPGGVPVEISGAPQPGSRLSPPSRYVCACERARTLGLRSWIPLPEQIRRTILWQRACSLDTTQRHWNK